MTLAPENMIDMKSHMLGRFFVLKHRSVAESTVFVDPSNICCGFQGGPKRPGEAKLPFVICLGSDENYK